MALTVCLVTPIRSASCAWLIWRAVARRVVIRLAILVGLVMLGGATVEEQFGRTFGDLSYHEATEQHLGDPELIRTDHGNPQPGDGSSSQDVTSDPLTKKPDEAITFVPTTGLEGRCNGDHRVG